MKENLLPIPGYAGYFIDPDTMETWSYKRRRPRKLKKFKEKEYYLFDGTGKRITIGPLRLLYCAQHSIIPSELGPDLCVILVRGHLQAVNLNDRLRENNRLGKTRQNARYEPDYYQKSIRWAQTVLDAYATGDYTQVALQIWSFKPGALEYMRKNNFAVSKNTAEELWSATAEYVLTGIKERRLLVGNPETYVYRVIRTLHAKRSRARKILRALKEDICRIEDSILYL